MPSLDQSNGLGPLLAAIAMGGIAAGGLDILVACAINHASPATILQAIASGLLGRASYDGGAGTAALGLVLQWLSPPFRSHRRLGVLAVEGRAARRIRADRDWTNHRAKGLKLELRTARGIDFDKSLQVIASPSGCNPPSLSP
jgi:hypothetical protein